MGKYIIKYKKINGRTYFYNCKATIQLWLILMILTSGMSSKLCAQSAVSFTTTLQDPSCAGGTNGSIIVSASGGVSGFSSTTTIDNGCGDGTITFNFPSTATKVVKLVMGTGTGSHVHGHGSTITSYIDLYNPDISQWINVFQVTAETFNYDGLVINFSEISKVTQIRFRAPVIGCAFHIFALPVTAKALEYSYSKDGGLNYQPSNSFTGLTAGSYSIIVKDAVDNLSTIQNITLIDPAIATVNAGSDVAILLGQSVQLNAVGTNPGVSSPASLNVNIWDANNNFNYTNDLCNDGYIYNPGTKTSSPFSITGVSNINSMEFKIYWTCSNALWDFQLNGVVIGSTGALSTGLCQCPQSSTGTYPSTFTITGAQLNANWNFNGNNTLTVIDRVGAAAVAGYTANINYTTGASYTWSPATGLTATNISNPIASPTTTTTYALNYTDANGCAATDGITVTVITNSITTGTIDNTLCPKANVSIPYIAIGTYNAGNTFTAQLSDASGSFASPVDIGSVSSTTSGSINATIPANVIYGTAYRIRVVSDNPVVAGTDNGNDLILGDNEDPTFTCPANADVNLDGSCQLIVPDLISELTGNDNCGTVNFTQSPAAGEVFSSSHNQTHTVTITADDGNDNTSSCEVILTGKDVTKPTFTCPADKDVTLNSSCQLVVPNLLGGLVGNDNCGTVTFTQNPAAGTSLPSSHGSMHNIVVTANDGNGNTEECTVVLTGKDLTKPTFTCPANDDVELTSSCQLIVPDLISTLTGNDNCALVVTFTQSPAAGEVLSSSHNQAHNIKIIAADGNGNTEECTVVLTGKDVIKPTFTCPANGEVNLNNSCLLVVPDLIAELTGNDNCGSVTFTQNPAAGEGLSSSHNQTHNIVITAHDGNGNTEECTVLLTAKDITPPTIACPDAVTVPLDFNSTVASNVSLGSPTFDDNCTGSSVGNNAPLTYALGATTVIWTVTDAATLTANCAQTVTVDKRQTAIEYIGGLANQYSDSVRLKAKLTDKLTGNPLSGKLISFTLGTQSETALTDVNGIAYKVMNLLQAPNTYNLKACFDGSTDVTYKSACDSDQDYLIKCEDAKLEYTGVTFVNTTCATCSKANILMSASVRDISAVDANDPYPGDISKAFITFTVKDVNNNVKFTKTLPVSLIDPNDKSNGFASTTYEADCGADPGASFTVELSVSGYYCASDQSIITIAKPVNEFITGGGWIKPVPSLSGGVFKSADDTKTNFGFNVKYNKSGKNLQGNVNVIFRRLECDGIWHVYQIKSTAMGTLTVNTSNPVSQTALFTGKTVLKDVTYPTSTFSIGGANLQLTITDKGEPGSNDMIGLTLTAGSATASPCGTTINNGALLFSSNWSTTKTTEVKLAGGNIVIRGAGASTTPSPTLTRGIQIPAEVPPVGFNVKVSPNPTENEFRLQVVSDSKKEAAITITDVSGRHIKLLTIQPGQVVYFGSELKTGLYVLFVNQGENRKTIKILKQ